MYKLLFDEILLLSVLFIFFIGAEGPGIGLINATTGAGNVALFLLAVPTLGLKIKYFHTINGNNNNMWTVKLNGFGKKLRDYFHVIFQSTGCGKDGGFLSFKEVY